MNHRTSALLALLLLSLAVACRQDPSAGNTPVMTAPAERATLPPPVAASSTPIRPTPTPTEPLAARVNGEPITLAEFEREVARYEAAQTVTTNAADPAAVRRQVLNALIERELIRQAAAAAGVVITPAQVDQRLAELRQASAESGDFDQWLQDNLWTEEEFREALAVEMIVGEMVSRVTADVPQTMEQVRARYIQMDDPAAAQAVLDRARAGDDFAFLAEQNSLDRVTGENGGDLGFFAPGSLLVPEVEAAAFALQPGEISDLLAVTSPEGQTVYYIVQVTEREPDRPLTADARFTLLQEAFRAWLDGQWAGSAVELLAP